MNKKQLIVGLILILLFSYFPVFSEDGTYDATVTTDSGTYTVPVEVEDGEVTEVHWPNGGDMSVSGAEISDSEATGVNSRGDSVTIELEDYNQEPEESEGDSTNE
jgi:type 1 fimbria pilin